MLRSLDLLDRPYEEFPSEFASLASRIFDAPIAFVALIDEHRQWFAGRCGLDAVETGRSISFCGHAINQPEKVMWIEDARTDPRFFDNPLVVGPPGIRFYAGAPLSVNGHAVGTLCVVAPAPRPYDARLADQLARLATLLSENLERRHRERALQRALEVSTDAIIECDAFGMITGWGHGAEQLFGYADAEALGQPVTLIVPTRFKEAHLAGMRRWRETGVARLGRRLELLAVGKNGAEFDIELSLSIWHKQGARFITSSIRDISERKAQATSLLKAKVDAEAANVAKSAFLANMSHEIRTPLNGVVGVVDLLASTPLSAYQAELTEIIRSSSHQLQRLLGDILDLARIEAGEFSLAEEVFSIEHVVSTIGDLCALRAHDKGLHFSAAISPEAKTFVVGDPVRLKQILTNLLTNAVKFTDHGSVRLTVSAEGDRYRFEVQDTGVGFGEEQRAAIFNRFQQADGSITRRFGGTGLGLAISRDIVAAMGGEIDCSGHVGEGATFWFELPLPPAQAVATPEDDIPDEPFDALRVLLADDNATNRRVVELILSSIGASVVSVEDGAEALNAFRSDTFDIVLMDMMMPVLDGLGAVRAIREYEAQAHLPATPVVMLTANTLPEHIERSLAAGANLHLAKPITAAGLIAAISSASTLRPPIASAA